MRAIVHAKDFEILLTRDIGVLSRLSLSEIQHRCESVWRSYENVYREDKHSGHFILKVMRVHFLVLLCRYFEEALASASIVQFHLARKFQFGLKRTNVFRFLS